MFHGSCSSLLLYVSLLKVVLYQHPVGPWCLTIVLGQLGNFLHPGFHGSGALGSFQFFLEHSLATSKNLGVSFNIG